MSEWLAETKNKRPSPRLHGHGGPFNEIPSSGTNVSRVAPICPQPPGLPRWDAANLGPFRQWPSHGGPWNLEFLLLCRLDRMVRCGIARFAIAPFLFYFPLWWPLCWMWEYPCLLLPAIRRVSSCHQLPYYYLYWSRSAVGIESNSPRARIISITLLAYKPTMHSILCM